MKFMFQNKSGETYPAYGCGRLQSVLSTDAATGNPVFELVKPDGQDGIYVINGPNNVADDGYGVAVSISDATLVLVDDGDDATAPIFGGICGPTTDRWAATTDGTGLQASGSTNNKTIPVVPLPSAGSVVAADGACPCICLDHGDILVGGIETTSIFEIAMSQEDFKQADGSIIFPAGAYQVVRGSGDTEWSLDIGDMLTAKYTSGTDATAATTMDGTLTMGFDAYGVPLVTLCVTGTVPAEP